MFISFSITNYQQIYNKSSKIKKFLKNRTKQKNFQWLNNTTNNYNTQKHSITRTHFNTPRYRGEHLTLENTKYEGIKNQKLAAFLISIVKIT